MLYRNRTYDIRRLHSMTAIVSSLESNSSKMRSLGNCINLILSRHSSENTANNYRGFYNKFFMYHFNKGYLDTNWDEFTSLTYDNILEYVNYLQDTSSVNTVKTKVAGILSLARELNKINSSVNPEIFNVKLDKVNPKSTEFGAFTEKEINQLLVYAQNIPSDKWYEQYMFFKLSIATAHRVQALLSLTWNDIVKKQHNDKDVWCVVVHDKTDDFITPISDELYDELYKMYKGNKDSKVLNITNKTLAKTLSNFCIEYGIDAKGRKLVLHSLKKTAGDIVFNKTNDIVKTGNFLHHTNINTSYNRYLGKNSNLTDMPSYSMFNDDRDIKEKLESLSKEELLRAIYAAGSGTINSVYNAIG